MLLGGVRVAREGGLYYFQIARNLARGAGSSFDGMHATNGYQPLWLLCLVPVFVVSSQPESGIRLATALQGLFFGGSAALVFRTARRHGRPAATLAALVWLALTYREALAGLEFALHAVCVLGAAALWLDLFDTRSPPSVRACLGLGSLVGLAFLARLDNLLLAAVIGVVLLNRERAVGPSREGVRRLLAFALPVALAAGAYAVVNLRLFGHVLPVSAAVKREWSLHLLSQDPLARAVGVWLAKLSQVLWPLLNLPQRYPLYLTAGGFLAAGLLLARARVARAWAPFAAFSLVQLLAHALWFHREFSFLGSSHAFVVQPLLASLLLAAAAERLLASGGRLAALARPALLAANGLVGLLILASASRWVLRERAGLSLRPDYDAAGWVNAQLPADAVLATWRTGAVAFLSDRRTLDLTGLVNSWGYLRHERRDLCGYWRRNGVTHLVDLFENGRAAVDQPSYAAYTACESRLERIWSDDRYGRPWRLEVYRLRPAPE